jgi:hypothetical protein
MEISEKSVNFYSTDRIDFLNSLPNITQPHQDKTFIIFISDSSIKFFLIMTQKIHHMKYQNIDKNKKNYF